MLVITLGWTAAAVGMLSALPQLITLLRSRSTEGCSLLLWRLNLAGGIGWCGHGLIVGRATILVPNVVLTLVMLAIVVTICRGRGLRTSTVVGGGVALGALVVAVDVVLGPVVFAATVFATALIGLMAQLREIVATDSLTGVSGPYLAIAVLVQLLWGSWAVASGEVATLLVASAVALCTSINLVGFGLRRAGLVRTRRRAEALALAA